MWLERRVPQRVVNSRAGPSSKSETALSRLRAARGAIGAEFVVSQRRFDRHGDEWAAAEAVVGLDARREPLALGGACLGRPATRISCAEGASPDRAPACRSREFQKSQQPMAARRPGLAASERVCCVESSGSSSPPSRPVRAYCTVLVTRLRRSKATEDR